MTLKRCLRPYTFALLNEFAARTANWPLGPERPIILNLISGLQPRAGLPLHVTAKQTDTAQSGAEQHGRVTGVGNLVGRALEEID